MENSWVFLRVFSMENGLQDVCHRFRTLSTGWSSYPQTIEAMFTTDKTCDLRRSTLGGPISWLIMELHWPDVANGTGFQTMGCIGCIGWPFSPWFSHFHWEILSVGGQRYQSTWEKTIPWIGMEGFLSTHGWPLDTLVTSCFSSPGILDPRMGRKDG